MVIALTKTFFQIVRFQSIRERNVLPKSKTNKYLRTSGDSFFKSSPKLLSRDGSCLFKFFEAFSFSPDILGVFATSLAIPWISIVFFFNLGSFKYQHYTNSGFTLVTGTHN